jgi:hypothetical protein
MKGADYGFHVMDKELSRKARSRFLPLFLARWYTRPRYTENPCKKPLAKYMRTQRAGCRRLRETSSTHTPRLSIHCLKWGGAPGWNGVADLLRLCGSLDSGPFHKSSPKHAYRAY